MRKLLSAEHYTDPVTGYIAGIRKDSIPDHTGHCLDVLRQGILCAVDVTYVFTDLAPQIGRAHV